MTRARKAFAFAVLVLFTATASRVDAYSVLSHEETVDMAWSGHIVPLLLKRYPNATPDELGIAHSYAYGGCIIQDLGYYPFGSKEFSDMLHYVRTGDFVNYLLKDADNLNEYAFALGALAHYRGDTIGHPSIGLATAREYPKLGSRFGPFVSYYDSPKAHIRTEYGFDVVQVAQGHYVKDNYTSFIGFNVATPVLERAFKDTYGVDVKTVLKHEGLAIDTYRYSVSTAIPEMTRAAVLHYGKQIQAQVPNLDRSHFVYRVNRVDYEHEWGKQYHKPGFGAHVIAFIIRILPKKGPFAVLKLQLPNAADQKLYLDSMQSTVNSYEKDLDGLRGQGVAGGTLPLKDLDYDTGKLARQGEYPLADKSYAKLLDTVTHDKNAQVSSDLRASLLAYYHGFHPRHRSRFYPVIFTSRKQRKLERDLTLLRATHPQTIAVASLPIAAAGDIRQPIQPDHSGLR
ncbi:MAG: zinc dependent phospholipase C family protein [Acidobacteriaceae bacterium]